MQNLTAERTQLSMRIPEKKDFIYRLSGIHFIMLKFASKTTHMHVFRLQTYIVLCFSFVCLRLVYPMLPVCLDCQYTLIDWI